MQEVVNLLKRSSAEKNQFQTLRLLKKMSAEVRCVKFMRHR